MKCDIIIVNWNSGSQLREAVESIRDFGGGHVGRTIIVDNGSSDDSMDFVREVEDIHLVELGANRGFGAACNIGAENANTDFLLFLNPDACLLPDTLEIISKSQKILSNEVDILGIQLLNQSGQVERSCSRFPTARRVVFEALGVAKIFPATGTRMTDWDHGTSREVDQVIGAFFLIRRNLFQTLGGFDERFFVYFEEVDLSYRARLAGFRSQYLATAQAYHKGGGVSEKVKAQRLFYSLRSRILYAGKHFTPVPAFAVAAVTLGPELLTRALFLAARGAFGEMGDLLRGYRMLWKWAIASRLGRRRTSLDGGS